MASQSELETTAAIMVDHGPPSSYEAATEIMKAVLASTLYADGTHANSIRAETPDWVKSQYPHSQGATVRTLKDRGILTASGEFTISGNSKSGNRTRPVPVWHVNKRALKKLIDERSRTDGETSNDG